MQVIVIGAGLIGLSTGFFLQRAGAQVTLVEKCDTPARGASYANGGLLTASMSHPWNEPGIFSVLLRSVGRENSPVLVRARALPSLYRWAVGFVRESTPTRYARNASSNYLLARYSLRLLQEFENMAKVENSPCCEGVLYLYRSQADLERARKALLSLPDEELAVERLSSEDMARREPALAAIEDEVAGALYFPTDRSGDAREYCETLATLIEAEGGRIHWQTCVKGFRREGSQVAALVTEDGRELVADKYVISAGSWSRTLARSLGIEVPVQPVKGYSLSIPSDGLSNLPRLPIVDSTLHAAITPLGSTLRVAGTAEFAGFHDAIAASRIRNLKALLARVLPRVAADVKDDAGEAWAGFRPVSQDGVPLIGPSMLPSVYLNTGHGHLGWTLAAGSGRLLADLMLGRVPEIDPTPYAPQRFRRSVKGSTNSAVE